MPRNGGLTPSFIVTAALLAWGALPDDPARGTSTHLRDVLCNDLPSRVDYDQMERGYYEQILDAGRHLGSGNTVDINNNSSTSGNPQHERLTLKVEGVREFVLKPNLVRDESKEICWSTNAEGMRDREYPREKPEGVFRVGLSGDSIATGWKVDDDEGFEPLLEQLFDARSRAAGGPRVEILNFAVPGHGPGQRWSHFATLGWGFSPDLVIYEATMADAGWDERRLRGLLSRGVGFDAPVYRDVLDAVGVKPGLTPEKYRQLLKPLRWEILAGVYKHAAAECRSHGVPIIFLLIPRVGKTVEPAERKKLLSLAHEAGFTAVIDVSDAFGDVDPRTLAVNPHDYHPNAKGHALIARALDDALSVRPEINALWNTRGFQGVSSR